MAPFVINSQRAKKRKSSFRRPLKTSNVKLDYKLKNRQFKKESTDKKHRKEQKKLLAAIKDAALKSPLCLERYKKRPEDEEEEFVEYLPIDMMDEDGLEQIKAMAQKASFLTRDPSLSGPVHAKKHKGEQQGPESYEKMPRKMQLTEEKEVIHFLPIKDKIRGLFPQSMEKPVEPQKSEEEADVDWLGAYEPLGLKDEAVTGPALTPQEQLKLHTQKLTDRMLRIASLGSDILSEPTINIKKLQELRSMLMETDPYMAVRKLVMVSLMEVFKDIVPSYRIRPLTETEKALKVKKETQQLREFEDGLVSQYKFYLEQAVKDWKQKKRKRSEALSLQSFKGLAEVAIRCICELLVALPHFNFHNNIIIMVVPLMNDPIKRMLKVLL
ncbi:nucleolar complex protein 3 homolog [Salvelinus fontinalis]|uniref:nucleolar complex protein 3 homolog n=1 Tax=Salvelinus fontinalis TaxID=8038 RepID=UPI00248634B8|nr:nucleolar complex protein 3 homolog [Salvelinus fontinalis]